MISPLASGRRGYVPGMRQFHIPAAIPTAVLVAAVVVTVAAAGSPFGASAVLVVLVCLAAAIVAFNWWEFWTTRRDR